MALKWLGPVIGSSLIAGLPATVLLTAAHQSAHEQDAVAAVVQSVAGSNGTGEQRDNEAGKDLGRDEPLGPPAWSRAHQNHRQGMKGHSGKAWKDAWHALTPAEREAKMRALAKAHAKGMQNWADCVAAARADATKRAACTKPLPPGLAKRLP